MKTMRSLRFLHVLAAVVCLCSCNVHEWPKPNNEPNGPTESYAYVNLRLEYNTMMYCKELTYDAKSGRISAVSDDFDSSYDNIDNIQPGTMMEATVKIHKNNTNRTFVSSESFIYRLEENFDTDVAVKVPVGDYIITVWSHLLDESGEALYDHSDFNSIGLIRSKYDGNNDMRDAFRGRAYISVPADGVSETVEMKRPMGKIEFITSNTGDFFTNEDRRLKGTRTTADDYTVVISYPYYYPCSYTAMDDRNEDALPGFSFAGPFRVNDGEDEETSLGFDYVLINDTESGAVQVSVALLYRDGTQVTNTGVLTIPIKRDCHTIVRGNFLYSNNGGGVGIDPDFEGDFNIPL